MKIRYKEFIEDHFTIVDKELKTVDFNLNKIQDKYLQGDMTGRDIILKARQQGFSSLITAIFTVDFMLQPNSYSIVIADREENAQLMLEKVKHYIAAYESKTGIKVPLKYDSKYELVNDLMKSRYHIGTADNTDFGRSRTVYNLHLSEAAHYKHLDKIMAAAGEAVVQSGRIVIESTANGFNRFKNMYDEGKKGIGEFKSLFYPASAFYDNTFLTTKKGKLKELFVQEYPENDIECFLTSGEGYFDKAALAEYLKEARPVKVCSSSIEGLSAANT